MCLHSGYCTDKCLHSGYCVEIIMSTQLQLCRHNYNGCTVASIWTGLAGFCSSCYSLHWLAWFMIYQRPSQQSKLFSPIYFNSHTYRCYSDTAMKCDNNLSLKLIKIVDSVCCYFLIKYSLIICMQSIWVCLKIYYCSLLCLTSKRSLLS